MKFMAAPRAHVVSRSQLAKELLRDPFKVRFSDIKGVLVAVIY